MSDEKTDGEDKDGPKANRWWEEYYVRYFVGTFVGVVVIFVLREKAALAFEFTEIIPAFKTLDGPKFAALSFVGLAYCYIASSPILVLHAVRGNWSKMSIDNGLVPLAVSPAASPPGQQNPIPAAASSSASVSNAPAKPPKVLDFKKGIWIVILACYLATAFAILCSLLCGEDNFSDVWAKKVGLTLGIVVPALQFVLIGFLVGNKFSRLIEFYDKLASKRSEESKAKRDYTDSYRHMREHGNAFAIVILEIAFGLVLSAAQTESQLVAVAVLWVLPASFCWFIGSVLETALAFRQ